MVLTAIVRRDHHGFCGVSTLKNPSPFFYKEPWAFLKFGQSPT
ncbi:Hypothetical protein I595_1547 [Croceitalea dokdonensis DOKDO 023]|uniref:Uncharacterized protein n=1 Tax=Croceitalea dokdonensis DOKDO 023 TaxID=1300341 RepID=A0A0N8H3Y9_9FLAO|nr:Hypothetical protein I595_1547 [Croceitalea dokdonensis DOKDO 023]